MRKNRFGLEVKAAFSVNAIDNTPDLPIGANRFSHLDDFGDMLDAIKFARADAARCPHLTVSVWDEDYERTIEVIYAQPVAA